VSAAKAGDAAAFDQLILRHQERVFALAYHMLGNAEDAADAQQETFLRAWTRLREFRGQSAFTTWLHRITVIACLSKGRRSRPTLSLEQNEALADGGNRTDCQESIVNAVVVRELLDSLPTNHRTLLVLREVEGMSIEEIAEITGSSIEAVRKQLWRVRKLFGERLRQCLMGGE
jgi:RNA polymerase sigma-70 factor (ECF subfamily)